MLKAAILGAVIATNIGVDFARVTYWGEAGGLESDLQIVQNTTGIEEFLYKWSNLDYTFSAFVGGYFTNATILLLALLWVLRARPGKTFDRVLLVSLFVGALPILFGDPIMQTRIFYDMPLHIPAALLLYSVVSNYRTHPLLGSTLALVVIIHLVNYALRSTANMYLVLP